VLAVDEVALIERFAPGREVTCGVLDVDDRGAPPRALPPTEIQSPNDAFYTYEARYAPGRSKHICPAPLGPTMATGNAEGVAVSLDNAFAYYDTIFTDGKTDTRGVWIVLSDKPNTCATQRYAGSTTLDLTLVGEPIAVKTYPLLDPASYPVSQGDPVAARVDVEDSSCHAVGTEVWATSGSIVIAAATSTHVSGTFTIKFKTGSVTGSFDAPVCPAPTGTPACMP
jgi:hypothetical protein